MDLNNNIIEKEKKLTDQKIEFVYDIFVVHDLESKISNFGSMSKTTRNVLVSNYPQLSNPVKVFGGFGKGKGKVIDPTSVVIDDLNERIFIADFGNSRIQVWNLEGEYLFKFGRGTLDGPWGIGLYDNFIYISDFYGDFLSKWCLGTLTLVKKSNTPEGSAPGQLNFPSGLDIDKERIFVVEFRNNRISVFNLNLEFIRILANNVISGPHCIRVRNNTIYILENTGVIKLFSKTDQLLKTIPKHSAFENIIHDFNLDYQLNFLVTNSDNSLVILSPEGAFICSISFTDFNLGVPCDIDISKTGRVVICFEGGSIPLALFYLSYTNVAK